MVSALLKMAVVVIVVGVVWRWRERSQRLPPTVEGYFRPEYQPVAELYRKFVEDGTERGSSFAVYQNGEPLIEMWGGYADLRSLRPWRNDTVTIVWSCAKGVSAAALAKLVERGLLDYKKEVREYWPEFAQNNKSNITVEMLLSHQGGLGSLGGASFSLQEYKHEWSKVEKVLAAATPDFEPGEKVGYHVFTIAMYVDVLIRRVDPKHRNLTQFFCEEIATPYGIDFFIGLHRELYHRAAWSITASQLESLTMLLDPEHRPFTWELLTSPSSYFMRAASVFSFFPKGHSGSLNDPLQMEIGVGSMMGFGAAGSLAKLYDYLANGGTVKDKVLLPTDIVSKFSVSLTDSLPSAISGEKLRSFSMGFMVEKASWGTRFGHVGLGGQQSWADPQSKFGIAYVTNFNWPNVLTPPYHYRELEALFYACYAQHQTKSKKE